MGSGSGFLSQDGSSSSLLALLKQTCKWWRTQW